MSLIAALLHDFRKVMVVVLLVLVIVQLVAVAGTVKSPLPLTVTLLSHAKTAVY